MPTTTYPYTNTQTKTNVPIRPERNSNRLSRQLETDQHSKPTRNTRTNIHTPDTKPPIHTTASKHPTTQLPSDIPGYPTAVMLRDRAAAVMGEYTARTMCVWWPSTRCFLYPCCILDMQTHNSAHRVMAVGDVRTQHPRLYSPCQEVQPTPQRKQKVCMFLPFPIVPRKASHSSLPRFPFWPLPRLQQT